MSAAAIKALQTRILADHRAGKLKLPSPPEVTLRIRHALASERHSAAQLARIVQLDPALAARLLQIANSARYLGNSKVSNCRDAIARLGLPATRNIATSLAMHSAFRCEHPKLKAYVQRVWQRSYHVGAISHVLGAVTPGLRPDLAMLGGLVHNIGVLPLLPYLAEMPELVEDNDMLELVVGRLRGRLGTGLLRTWKFDDELVPIPEQADDWLRDTPGPADYVDVVLVARIHAEFGSKKNSVMMRSLKDMPAFKKMPISRFGADGSIQLLEEANEEIATLKQLLRGEGTGAAA